MKSKKCKGCVHFFPKGTTPYSYDVCNFMLIGKGIQTLSECPNGKPQYREYKEENQMTKEDIQKVLELALEYYKLEVFGTGKESENPNQERIDWIYDRMKEEIK